MVVTAPTAAPRAPAAALRPGWDSEAFVLQSDDPAQLRERALTLAATLERQPQLNLSELAAGLAAEVQPGGSRLAVVAASHADLQAKLRRAADRLADPKCKQIRDAAGIYYFDQPLYQQGTLALLFPGEGAQYPDMLADLCGIFPEVRDTFDWCDQIAAEAGRPHDSLRRVLHLPPESTAEDRALAEAELRKLGPSIFGVLIADFAIVRVLWNLQLPVAAVAGHSAGELAALLAAGAMQSQAVLGPRLMEIQDMMQLQEDEAGGPEIVLLAVGAGKAAVQEVAGSVFIAMDNCPHQCVAVGPTREVAAVETALTERGLICERLPFRRPYHTPLFEPWMGPFRELFADVPFARPQTPVYCCSTGQLFPDDPDAIRELTVNHWVNPVEFARMIETMYADGVRVFVEAGPRGNLSAFVEDVLRGRPFVAIPANVARKSGPTQINHLAAQLAAHHVPFNIGHLHGASSAAVANASGSFNHPVADALGSPVLHDYLAVMEQFLDVQREVMEAFLAGHPIAGNSMLAHAARPESPLCLVGEIVAFEPGQSIILRRPLDEREDLYADDHTLGGRGVSRVNPAQNGLPILPMTFSLEAAAQAAMLLVPGKVVVGIRNVRLYRWVPFDAEPTTLEVRASVASFDPEAGLVEVKADVRDLGNSFLPDAANKPASEAIVVLADRFPEAPEPLPFRLTDEVPCKSTVEDLRRNMFHGPLFQMIRTLGRTGKEGIEGTLEVQPRDRWFRSNPDPQVVFDPALVDAAMHILGAWHLEQPDWSGRILLPIGVGSLEFFGPPPTVGSQLLIRGHNEEETTRQVRHGLEVFTHDGRLWLRMAGASYWRFYLPFGDVNFFGPKDQYFLSSRWREAELPGTACQFLEVPLDLQQPVLRASGVRVTMTPREIAEFHAWKGTDAGQADWFFSRLVAKDAVRAAWHAKHGEGVFPADIEAEPGGAGGFRCWPRGEPKAEPFPTVKAAMCNGKVAAVAAFAETVGIALLPVAKGDNEEAVRTRAARAAVGKAEGSLVEPGSEPGLLLVSHGGRKLRVQTTRQKDVIVAVTLGEGKPA